MDIKNIILYLFIKSLSTNVFIYFVINPPPTSWVRSLQFEPNMQFHNDNYYNKLPY